MLPAKMTATTSTTRTMMTSRKEAECWAEEITGVICGFRETRNNFYVSIGGWPFTLGTLVRWINKDTGEPFGVKHSTETENN